MKRLKGLDEIHEVMEKIYEEEKIGHPNKG